MEIKKILETLGIDVNELDSKTDEEIEAMVKDHVDKNDEHIKTLESEKEALSKSNEELVASVEGHKSNEEKLNKELSETKGRLSQISEMYKEQFTKDPEEQEQVVKSNEDLQNDVLQQLIDSK